MRALPAPAPRLLLPAPPPRPGSTIRIIARLHPLREERIMTTMPAGIALAEILDRLQLRPGLRAHAVVQIARGADLACIDVVPAEMWGRLRPRAGAVVVIRVAPAPPAVALAAAIAGPVLSAALTGATIFGITISATVASLIGGVVSLGLSLAAKALVRPNKPALPRSQQFHAPPRPETAYSLTDARNDERPYEVIPCVLGRYRVRPPRSARPWTWTSGNEQYLTVPLVWSGGPVSIDGDSIRVGDTPLAAFPGAAITSRAGWPGDAAALSPTTTIEADPPIQIELDAPWEPHTRTTVADTGHILLDFVFPGGLGVWDATAAALLSHSVALYVVYRPVEGNAVQQVHVWSAATRDPLRRSVVIYPAVVSPSGTYEVSVSIGGLPADTRQYQFFQDAYWTSLKSVRYQPTVAAFGIAESVVTLRGSGELQGVADTISGIIAISCPDWDAASGTWITRTTTNPASLFRHVLQGPINPRPRPDHLIDLDSLQEWHAFCAARGFGYNAYLTAATDQEDLLYEIASAGRAAPTDVDGRIGVVIDQLRPVPVQAFTPRNSWGYRVRREIVSRPHALRVHFANEQNDWRDDERIVYADGYNASNASEFETWDLPGVTNPAQIYALARYHQAVGKLRPETHSFYTSERHLLATRGDLIRIAHDVPRWNIQPGWPRVAAVVDDGGGNATGVELDDAVWMEPDRGYAARFVREGGDQPLFSVQTRAGERTSLVFAAPVPLAAAPGVGDLVLFGEASRESVELVIRSIEHGPDLTARVVCVEHAPGVFDVDAEPIPEFESKVDRPLVETPAVPAITDVASDEAVMERLAGGGLAPRLYVGWRIPPGFGAIATEVQVRTRPAGTSEWALARAPDHNGGLHIRGVQQGMTYEIAVRALGRTGLPSAWSATVTHTIVGQSSPPPDVPSLFRRGDEITWTYPDPPPDFRGFLVGYQAGVNATWATAVPLHPWETPVAAPPFSIASLGPGTWTVMLKAVDQTGNESAAPAVLVAGLGDRPVANVVDEEAFAPAWPGHLYGGEVRDGELRPGYRSTYWSGVRAAPFWTGDRARVHWAPEYQAMTYAFAYAPPDEGRLSFEADIVDAGAGWTLQIRPRLPRLLWTGNRDNPIWTGGRTALWWGGPQAGTWTPLASGALDVTAQAYEGELVVHAAGPALRPAVRQLTALLDVDDVSERLEDIAIAAGGSRLPITRSYKHRITNVSLTVQHDGQGAIALRLVDKDRFAGPLVQGVGAGGAPAAATIDAMIQGH